MVVVQCTCKKPKCPFIKDSTLLEQNKLSFLCIYLGGRELVTDLDNEALKKGAKNQALMKCGQTEFHNIVKTPIEKMDMNMSIQQNFITLTEKHVKVRKWTVTHTINIALDKIASTLWKGNAMGIIAFDINEKCFKCHVIFAYKLGNRIGHAFDVAFKLNEAKEAEGRKLFDSTGSSLKRTDSDINYWIKTMPATVPSSPTRVSSSVPKESPPAIPKTPDALPVISPDTYTYTGSEGKLTPLQPKSPLSEQVIQVTEASPVALVSTPVLIAPVAEDPLDLEPLITPILSPLPVKGLNEAEYERAFRASLGPVISYLVTQRNLRIQTDEPTDMSIIMDHWVTTSERESLPTNKDFDKGFTVSSFPQTPRATVFEPGINILSATEVKGLKGDLRELNIVMDMGDQEEDSVREFVKKLDVLIMGHIYKVKIDVDY